MIKTTTTALAVLGLWLATSAPARAGGQADTLGIGAEYMMNGAAGGISLNYDMGALHFGGFLSFLDGGDDDDTDYSLGGRIYYHLHSTAMSDFGIGGALGFYSDENPANGDRATFLFLEPGIQIRAFVTSNVALSFNAGLVFALQDGDGTFLTGGTGGSDGFGGVTGGAGVHYYFF
ncbi:MAG: hypothetical protein M3680_14285 [Myxococcota bacterium]|nr:hypothetical protein [Myxococcota bacterium]